ncbi:substrate-binding domain-containing protein [Anaerosacchariphilus polymeriproducens]|uniref:Sugar ABC transporter substrate-binding protein n=1 Tax=Anaerosacchariphilus polymeriproducens TaxID=1812858 RepID=A0A371AY84_9FIRM|nr:substrate-binding domain-containing protein [Anaerosacchariphilus polymeriproducens]RDU24517.1 sugar ABC transporter substrate-binding protein [Anaerosacchariphilus polymeriproducens]
MNALEENIIDQNPKESYVFGGTFRRLINPFFTNIYYGIKRIVDENGDTIIPFDADVDQEVQNKQIEEMIERGVDGIFVAPVYSEKVEPAIKAANEAGIPVFIVDLPLKDETLAVSTITSDNNKLGELIADDIMSRMDSAKILILDYPYISTTHDRVIRIIDRLKEKTEYEVIIKNLGKQDYEYVRNIIKDAIKENPDINVVVPTFDIAVLGAIAGLRDIGKEKDVIVYGIDGAPLIKNMVKEGKMIATTTQLPIEMGMTAAETAYAYLEGYPVTKKIIIPVALITKENLAEFADTYIED